MCRLFGMLGGAQTPAEPWLVSTDRSLLVQSNTSEKHAQKDGWGVAWYEATRTPRIEKGVGGAFAAGENPHFRDASHRAHGPLVIGHLRHASNPMNLPHERLIARENSQPFTHGSYLFAHNGSITYPKETRPLLGAFESHVRGVNDSEVLFYLFARHLEERVDPVQAYARTVADLIEVGRQHPKSSKALPYTGLNVLFTRGPNELWAFCHWLGEHGSRFLDAEHPYYEMTYFADAKVVVVGSEPFDSERKDWRSIPNGTFLYAHAAHGLIGVKTGPIPLPIDPLTSPAPSSI